MQHLCSMEKFLTVSTLTGAVSGLLYGGYSGATNHRCSRSTKFDNSIDRTLSITTGCVVGGLVGSALGASSIVTVPIFTCDYLYSTYKKK